MSKPTPRKWTPEDKERLKTMFAGNKSLREIATALGFSVSQVHNQVHFLGLERSSPPPHQPI